MKQELIKAFQNDKFGNVRVVLVGVNQEPYFVGKDVAECLGYVNASKAVSTHVDEEDRILETIEAHTQNGNVVKTQTTLINESGLYSLILSSKLPSAKEFKRWVTSEVLPTLRETGSYSTIQSQSMSMEDIIIYQMQQSKLMKEQLEQTQTVAIEAKATAEQATKQMEIVKDAMLLDHDSWRKDCNNIINKVAKERGGTKEAYQQVRDEVYNLLQQRAGANLKQRVINKQDRMRREGISKSKVDKVSQIDVIAEDKHLKEIYIAVVKEMAIKYGVA
ncbi:Bro-N domain-containing protein [Zhenhengia sp.]|uniref:BRO-N domain-containing protein n=1 Tax=Zhenhengia sp. TaxID=2944208 RepID=UPI003079B935